MTTIFIAFCSKGDRDLTLAKRVADASRADRVGYERGVILTGWKPEG